MKVRWQAYYFTFMRNTFLIVTVKKWLKSVYVYGSYRKINRPCRGITFWTTLFVSVIYRLNMFINMKTIAA